MRNRHAVSKQGALTAMLGTIPETLSRALYKLSREGAIAVEGNTIPILDREYLIAVEFVR